MPRYLPVWLALVVAACGHNLVSTAPRALLAGTLLAPAMPGRAAAGLLADLPLPGIGRGADALVGHNAAGLRGVPGMPGVGGLAGVQALDEATASTVPVMRAPVLAIDAAGKPVPGAGAFTGPYGRFSIRGVPAGRHLLISSAYAVDREPQVQLALVAAEGGGADVVLDPAMSAATARALAAAGGHLEAIDPGRVAAAAKALRQEGARFSAADLGSAAALAGAYARAEAASAKVEQSDPGAGIPPALAAAGTATPLASPDYQDLVDMLANEGAAAFAPAPEASELAAALREAERPGDAQAGLPGGAPSTSAATGGEDPVAVAPGPDPATPSGPPAEAPGLAATPIGPAASPTPDVAPPAGPGSANPAIATPAPTPHPATPAPPVASPAPQVATPAPAAATPAPTPRPTPGFTQVSPLPAYDTARFGWEHGGPYAGAPVIPALLGFAAQAASPLDGLLDAAATAAGNHLIVVGGRRSEAGTPVQATYAAPVGADGSLGTVVRLADLAVAVARPALLFTGRYLYAIGGEASGGPTATIQRAEWVGGALLPFEIAAYLPVSVWPPVVASSGSMAVVVGAAGAAAFRIEPDLSLSAPAGLALRSDGRSPSFAAFAGPWLFLGGGGAGDYLVADCTADPAALAFHRWAEEPDGPAGGHRAAVDGATVWLAPDTRAEVGVVGLGSRGPTAHLAAGWALADPRRKHAMAVVRGTLLVVGGTPAAPPEGARILAP